VLNYLNVGQLTPDGKIPGFNVDDRVSGPDDALGCYQPDLDSTPPDSFTGVDNELGPLLTDISGVLDVPSMLTVSIAEGKLLVLVEIEGVDDPRNDDDVTVSMMYGATTDLDMPDLGLDGLVAPCQTFNLLRNWIMADGMTPMTRFPGSTIVDGRVRAEEGSDFPISIPLLDGTRLELIVMRPRARFDLNGWTIERGVVGGALDVGAVAEATAGLAPELSEFIDTLLQNSADLDPTPTVPPLCQSISVAFVYSGVRALKGVLYPTE
jgi:hypothetical protein